MYGVMNYVMPPGPWTIFFRSTIVVYLWAPPAFLEGGARIGQGGCHLTAVNTLSAFGRFNERGGGGGGGAVRFWPI